MPEGDTIHRLATRLAPRLVGQALERVTTQGLARALDGRTVASVTAHGKHLVMELDDGTSIRAHLGMYGRQRSFPRAHGEAVLARMSPGRASLALVTADAVHLWIGAPTIEISARRAPRHGMAVAALGQDVLGERFDGREAAARAAVHADRTIGEVLLDQRVAAGIGNIWKSESLFHEGIDPRTPVKTLTEPQLVALYVTARELMLQSTGRSQADLTNQFFVYSRSGHPCRRCGTPIDCYQLAVRWTWSCPHCQTPGGASR